MDIYLRIFLFLPDQSPTHIQSFIVVELQFFEDNSV